MRILMTVIYSVVLLVWIYIAISWAFGNPINRWVATIAAVIVCLDWIEYIVKLRTRG